jgi:hypothetical protein
VHTALFTAWTAQVLLAFVGWLSNSIFPHLPSSPPGLVSKHHTYVRFEVFTAVTMKNDVLMSSGMLRRVALVRTDVSEELSASVIRVTRIGELGTTLAVTSN